MNEAKNNEDEGRPGVLAVWNDCAPGEETVYEEWYRTEHLLERVRVPGFRAGWRYMAIEGSPQYFTHYETDSVNVLFSNAYREQLDTPTELTQRVMSGVFIHATRAVCERIACFGELRGALVAVMRQPEGAPLANLRSIADTAFRESDDAVRAEAWLRWADPVEGLSSEQSIRGPDATVAGAVMIQCPTEAGGRDAFERLRSMAPADGEVGLYRALCALHRPDC
ncbi:MAG: hypothetical protein AAF493_14800 [Pseudomonadota bacterium]